MTLGPARNYKASYADAGVDIDAGNQLVEQIKPAVQSTNRAGSMGSLGGFGGLFDLKAAGYTDPLLVAATDGVGTKLKLAIDSGIHSSVGIDLVAMCVNDLIVQGAEPLFFLDYFATGKLDPHQAAEVVEGIAAGCRMAGCALIGGETAEMPGLYQSGDYDLAGFCAGAVNRDDLLPKANMVAGDKIIALPSSGLHSNGFSLVRQLVDDAGLMLDAPAPFGGNSVAEELLTPTRIYVRALLQVLRECQNGAVKGLAHITGGGLSENIPRVLPNNLAASVNLAALPQLDVFNWLQQAGNVAEAEMQRTFNLGLGFVVAVAAADAEAALTSLAANGETATVVGRMVAPGADVEEGQILIG